MKKRIDIMVDLETLGLNSDSQVMQISAVSFDITGKVYDIEVFNQYINIFDKLFQFNKVDLNTVDWWIKTDVDLFMGIIEKCKNSDKNEYEVLEEFKDYINNFYKEYENVYLWSNGISFDIKILKDKMNSYGINLPIKYNSERDVRTIVDFNCCELNISEKDFRKQFEVKDMVKHDALNDCFTQIDWVVSSYKNLIYGIDASFEMRDN